MLHVGKFFENFLRNFLQYSSACQKVFRSKLIRNILQAIHETYQQSIRLSFKIKSKG
jgi:hypothetical protein